MTLFQSFLYMLGVVVSIFLFFTIPQIIAKYITLFFDIPEYKNLITFCIMLSDFLFTIVYYYFVMSNKNKN